MLFGSCRACTPLLHLVVRAHALAQTSGYRALLRLHCIGHSTTSSTSARRTHAQVNLLSNMSLLRLPHAGASAFARTASAMNAAAVYERAGYGLLLGIGTHVRVCARVCL